MGLTWEMQVSKIRGELNSLKSKIDSLKDKKAKNPATFTRIEQMELTTFINAYNNLVAKIKDFNEKSQGDTPNKW